MTWMCARLGIPRASYYRWLEQKESATAARHRELTGQVKAMFDSSDGIFGHRMVHTKLAAAGVEVCVGTVAAIMAENGWAAKNRRRVRIEKRAVSSVYAALSSNDAWIVQMGEEPGNQRQARTWRQQIRVIAACRRPHDPRPGDWQNRCRRIPKSSFAL